MSNRSGRNVLLVLAVSLTIAGRADAQARDSRVLCQGHVVGLDVFAEGPNGQPGIHTRIRVAVERVSEPNLTEVEFWVHGGTLNGFRRVVSSQPTFEVGEHILVELFRSGEGTLWPALRGKLRVQSRQTGIDSVREADLPRIWREFFAQRSLQPQRRVR